MPTAVDVEHYATRKAVAQQEYDCSRVVRGAQLGRPDARVQRALNTRVQRRPKAECTIDDSQRRHIDHWLTAHPAGDQDHRPIRRQMWRRVFDAMVLFS
jgi:hypothetical protein